MPMPGPTSPVWTSAATLPALRHSAPTPSWVVRFSPYERGYHLRAGFPTQDTSVLGGRRPARIVPAARPPVRAHLRLLGPCSVWHDDAPVHRPLAPPGGA